ncbi:DUF983 domain-containing protein [Pontixanthobacter gangjinensis]|uniref:DUF983 domain-containing protein n=1 Tax=Pontixanthobacter gangjinensis TaxID=1028742 RepID=A0A6I4SSE3_9SPHN|nr:DUF983 domain-containing protein [Pontixanthobacter gangjinensis]MXO57442.1 DUF983 domain-containing protein [Pontixanthobacter gangjinensis]
MSGDNPETETGQPSIGQAALFGLCPNCGARSLFDGLAEFASKCSKCGLDFSKFNVGDGPAGFLTLIIGAFIVGLALWLEVSLSPPFWVHALIWIPLTMMCVFGGLRAAKAALLFSEYSQNAGEGTIKK